MSVKNEYTTGSETVVLERPESGGVYASLFEKINLNPVSELSALDIWQDAQAMQAHFFGTLNAGEELWERIRNLLKETAPVVAVLTCMYRTLQLGFVGQYPISTARRHLWSGCNRVFESDLP
ncbi:hypothetical protein D3C78_489670 [compost metagenome]